MGRRGAETVWGLETLRIGAASSRFGWFGPGFEIELPDQNKNDMPAKSEKQRRLMGAALSYKRGENKHPSGEVKQVAESMTEKQLADMAKKPRGGKKTK